MKEATVEIIFAAKKTLFLSEFSGANVAITEAETD